MRIESEECIFFLLRDGLDKYLKEYSKFYPLKIWKFINYKSKFCILFFFKYLIFDYRRNVKNLNALIQGDDYRLFIPHLYGDIYNFLLNEDACRGYILVEEGDASYSQLIDFDPISIRDVLESPIIRFIRKKIPKLKALGNGVFYPLSKKFIGVLCYQYGAFSFAPKHAKRYEFDYKKSFHDILDNQYLKYFQYSTIVVVLVAYSEIDDAIKTAFDNIKSYMFHPKKEEILLICFHPAHRNNEFYGKRENFIKYLIKNGYNAELYDHSVEKILINFDVKIIGATSSINRYAVALRKQKMH